MLTVPKNPEFIGIRIRDLPVVFNFLRPLTRLAGQVFQVFEILVLPAGRLTEIRQLLQDRFRMR